MEEPNSKQPQIPETNKTPERVVRTYQGDLAKIGKSVQVPLETKEQPVQKNQAPTPSTEGLKVPPQREAVEFPKQEIEEETKTHYVEEIQTTDSIDLNDTDSFTKKDIDSIGAVPPKPKAPAPTAPVQKEVPKVTTKETSEPKKSFVSSAFAWLMGGTGDGGVTIRAPKEEAPSIIPPKKLEGVPVIPNVSAKKAALEKQVQPAAPQPPETKPAPELEPEIPHQVVLTQKEEAPKPSNSLFAPPQEVKREEAPAVSLPPQPPRTEFKEAQPLSTYTSDARRGIKEQKHTRLSVLASQQDSKKAPPKKLKPKKSSMPIIVTSVILVVLGAGVVGGALFFLRTETAPVSTPQRAVTPVFAENRTNVTASATPTIEDLQNLLLSVNAPAPNTLSHVTFSSVTNGATEIIPFSDILLNTSAVPGTLARTAYPQSMFGIYGETKEPVLVLAVTSFERSFKSLLTWEDKMSETLAPLFGSLNTLQVGTTTPEFIQKFVDEEIETTDARILYDAAGDTHIIYGYITPNILFITKTKETFIDLTNRIVQQ